MSDDHLAERPVDEPTDTAEDLWEDFFSILGRSHMAGLSNGEVTDLFEKEEEEPSLTDYVKQGVRLLRVERIVYSKKREKLEELLNVFASLDGQPCSVVLSIIGNTERLTLALGLVSQRNDYSELKTGRDTLEAAMEGNFPGSKLTLVKNKEAEAALSTGMFEGAGAVAAITGIPSLKTGQDHEFVQGLDRYLESMRGKDFAVVVVADPVSREELEATRDAYMSLHSALSGFAEQQISSQHTHSLQLSETDQRSASKAFAETLGATQTTTTSSSTSKTLPSKKAKSYAKKLGIAGGGLVALPAAAYGAAIGIGAGIPLGPAGMIAGGVIGGAMGAGAAGAGGAVAGAGLGLALGGQDSESTSTSSATAEQHSLTNTVTETTGQSFTHGATTGQTQGVTLTVRDRRVQRAMELLDRHLERLESGSRYGFWNTGIYFLAKGSSEAIIGTSVLRGLFTGESSELEPPQTHLWSRQRDRQKLERVLESLRFLRHPRVLPEGMLPEDVHQGAGIDFLHPTTLLSSNELALVMGLPERSTPGVVVTEMPSFGRQVTRTGPRHDDDVWLEIGRIYHVGSRERMGCRLHKRSLAMHTLVTGSTGSGKTNTTKRLVASLARLPDPMPFLVIEPVKREYAGLTALAREGWQVRLLSAGSGDGAPLRLNPFELPTGIHVYEHIDRLVQVFNAAFPMYASMPALLEEGIRRSYEAAGWDLSSSRCRSDAVAFPTLIDLEEQLSAAVDEAGYSDQLRADFHGALVTRVRSLGRGIRGEMLCPLPGEATTAKELFEEPCVVNLSSISSPETKALVTALLMVKLYEHRVVQSGDARHRERVAAEGLTHFTVLEEAHHLLKRQSTEVMDESANLSGLAVEMFANAIAEMRAMGEGFVIVDQSPTSLDLSAIKNTNTKIAHRTPFKADRDLVGEAMNATEDQINEIGRLETGVAAVYQNDWLEPVLCQVQLSGVADRAPKAEDAPSGALFTREQILALFAVPLVTERESARTVAEEALEGHPLSLDEAIKQIGERFGAPVVQASLFGAYDDDGPAAYKALRRHLAPRATEADDGDVVMAALARRFALRREVALRVLNRDGRDSPEWRAELRHLFG